MRRWHFITHSFPREMEIEIEIEREKEREREERPSGER
jgi:hypothetical protein